MATDRLSCLLEAAAASQEHQSAADGRVRLMKGAEQLALFSHIDRSQGLHAPTMPWHGYLRNLWSAKQCPTRAERRPEARH